MRIVHVGLSVYSVLTFCRYGFPASSVLLMAQSSYAFSRAVPAPTGAQVEHFRSSDAVPDKFVEAPTTLEAAMFAFV